MVSGVPDRWLEYKACGKIIDGTRIICFKVPLKKTLLRRMEPNKKWGVEELLITVPDLGLVIDLTNTKRYYEPEKLISSGIQYKKIFMPGRIIPPEKIVLEFMNAVDAFFKVNKEHLIGVHCTHGLNRTGYMVCRYMRDRLLIPAPEAIRRFELARGYQIERDNYIAALLGKSLPPPDLGPGANIKPLDCEEIEDIYENEEKEEQEEGPFEEVKSKRKTKKKSSGKRKRSKAADCNSDLEDSYDFKYDY